MSNITNRAATLLEPTRKDQDRLKLQRVLKAGAASAPAAPADASYFEKLRNRVRNRAKT
ncbi:MAG TPA: hypothetical protein VIC30_11730 [Orrella sp.]